MAKSSKEKQQKPVLEEIRTFPAGRNKIAFFGIKKMPKNRKKQNNKVSYGSTQNTSPIILVL